MHIFLFFTSAPIPTTAAFRGFAYHNCWFPCWFFFVHRLPMLGWKKNNQKANKWAQALIFCERIKKIYNNNLRSRRVKEKCTFSKMSFCSPFPSIFLFPARCNMTMCINVYNLWLSLSLVGWWAAWEKASFMRHYSQLDSLIAAVTMMTRKLLQPQHHFPAGSHTQ